MIKVLCKPPLRTKQISKECLPEPKSFKDFPKNLLCPALAVMGLLNGLNKKENINLVSHFKQLLLDTLTSNDKMMMVYIFNL